MVKEIQVWKSTFYKNDDKNNGAMKKAIDCANGLLIVHSQTKKMGRIWGCVTPERLLKLVSKNNGLYEVITSYPHKVYFDIDKKIENDSFASDMSFLKSITDKIASFFPNAEMAVSGSITLNKVSYHIILQNYAVSNENEKAHLKNIVKFLSKDEPAFDWKVYHNNQFFKCINQSKDDGRIQKIIQNDDSKAHLITCFMNQELLPFPDVVSEELHEHIEIEKAHEPFDVGTLPKRNLITPDDVDFLNITPEQILALLPCDDSFNHNYTHRAARFCFYNNIPFEEFIKWRSQKSIDAAKIKKWKEYHFANIHKFPSVSIDQMKMTLIQFYPKINKNIHFRSFQKSFDFDTKKVIKIPRLSPKEFEGEEKVSVFNIGMGGGKTAQTVDYLKGKPSFLWIAPMRALCNNTFNRLKESNIDVEYYTDFKTKDKKNGCLNAVDKLLIVANSLHYLKKKTYDIIVIDEIETFIDKWHGTFMDYKRENWEVFLNVLRKSKKIILLDAFITTKTIHLLESIVGKDIVVYERIVEPITREVHYIKEFETCVNKIITDIKNGLKPFIFYPFKEQSLTHNEYVSMEALYTMIQKETNTEGIYYNADIEESVKLGLRDVNASWKNKRFVITNSIITCGVNYDLTDFDNEYLFVASFTSPRDITQVSYRPRTLNTNIINCCFLGRMTQTNSWETDDLNCPIYSQMSKSIFTEKKSPIRKTVELFFSKANYKQFTSDLKLSEDTLREINDMLDKQVCVSYRLVDDIDFGYADIIQQKIFASEATMTEKFMLQKYFFKKQFVDNDETFRGLNAMEYAWNANNAYFIKQCKRLISDPDNVFEKIKILNSEETIFPTDIKSIVLNDAIIKQIFNEFEFKYVHSKSGKAKIIENMFNAYFGKKIVKFIYPTKNTAPNYDIPQYEEFVFFYDFTKKYSTDFVVEEEEEEEEEEDEEVPRETCKIKIIKQVAEDIIKINKLKMRNIERYF